MSTEYERLVIAIETDLSNYGRGMSKATKDARSFASDVEKIGSQADSSAKKGSQAFGKLEGAIREARTEANRPLDVKTRADDSAVKRLIGAIQSVRSEAGRGAKLTITSDSRKLDAAGAAVDDVRRRAAKGASMNIDTGNSESQVRSLNDALADVAVTAAGVAGGMGLEDLGSGIADNMREASIATSGFEGRLGVTEAKARSLAGIGRDVFAGAWGESLAEVNQAVTRVSQGLQTMGDPQATKRLTEQALTLQDISSGAIEVEESVDAARIVSKNFGVEAGTAFDLLTVGTQRGANASDDLTDSLREYSPYFDELGLSADQAMAMFVAGAEEGIWQTDRLGDAIKEFSIRAVDGTDLTREGFKAAGLSADEMSKAISKGGPAAEEAFKKTLEGLASIKDPREREAAGVALFGTLWEDVGNDALTAMQKGSKGLEGYEGATKKAGDSLYDNFTTKVQGASRELQMFVGESGLGPLGGALNEIMGPAANTAITLGAVGFAAKGTAPWLWGTATAAWAAYAPLIALAGVGLIAVGIAYTFDYEGFNEARKKAKEEGEWAGAQYAEGVLAGLETVPVLNQISEWIGDGVDALTKNAPEVTLWDVLTGENKASENEISSRLQAAYSEVSGLLDGMEPKTSLWDVLSGHGKVSETPFLGGLMAAYDSSTAWMASLKPETSLWDVLTDRKKASEHSLLEPLATAYASATEWMAELKPETSLWDVITGKGKVSETPFLGGLMSAYTGATEWMAELAPETSLWEVLTGKGKAEENPILGRLQSSYAGASEFIAGLKPETSLWDVLTGRGDSENSEFLTNLNTTWTTARDTVVARAGEMGEGAGSYLAQLKEGAIARFTETRDGGIALVSELRDGGISGAAQMSAGVIERSLGMKEGTLANFLATKTGGVDLTEQMKTGVVTLVENLKSGTMSVLDTMPSGVRGIFEAVGDAMVNPVETARDALQGVWNSILDGISKVLNAVGMDKLAGDVAGAKWATGGTTQGGRPQTGAFATGGVVGVSAFAEGGKGGMGTGAARPRLHLWNEQQGPEAYIVKNRPTSEQLPYLSTAASWHGYELSKGQRDTHDHLQPYRGAPGYSEAKRSKQLQRVAESGHMAAFKDGGTIDVGSLSPNTSYPWQTNVGKAVTAFYEVGVNDVTTYEGHSPSMDLATDVWVGGSTYGQVPSDDSKFMGFANWVVGNMGGLGAEYVIAKQQINMGGGWSMMEDRGSMTQNHMDHVHVSFIPGAGGGTVGATLGEFASPGGGSGAGGGIVRSLWDTVGSAIWDRTVGKVWDEFKSSLPQFPLAQAIGGAGDMVLGGIKQKIIAESGSTTTGGSLPGGSSPSGLTIGEALKQGGWPENLLVEASSTVYHESGGQADAQNPSGASGLMQIMPATAEGVGADPSKLFDPIYNTATGLKVYEQAGGWGPWVAAGQGGDYRDTPVTGYSLGGILPGAPGKDLLVKAHSGEGIVPRVGYMAISDLAKSVQLWSAKKHGLTSGADIGIDPDSQSDRLVEVLERVEQKLDRIGLSEESRRAIERGARRAAGEEMVGTAGRAAFAMHSAEDDHDYSLKGGI